MISMLIAYNTLHLASSIRIFKAVLVRNKFLLFKHRFLSIRAKSHREGERSAESTSSLNQISNTLTGTLFSVKCCKILYTVASSAAADIDPFGP